MKVARRIVHANRDFGGEEEARQIWSTVPRLPRRLAAVVYWSGVPRRPDEAKPRLPAYYGEQVELAAWIVDAVNSDNPWLPLPQVLDDVLSLSGRELLATLPPVESTFGRGGIEAVCT